MLQVHIPVIVDAPAGHPATAALTAAGHTLTVTEWKISRGWYAELRTPRGFWLEGGFGLTRDAALAHLETRLAARERP